MAQIASAAYLVFTADSPTNKDKSVENKTDPNSNNPNNENAVVTPTELGLLTNISPISHISNNNKIRIAVDVDEVLGEFLPNLLIYHNRKYNTVHTFNDYYSYCFSLVWNCTDIEQTKRVNEFAYDNELGLHNLNPIQDSLQILTKYSNKFEYHVVTARSNEFRDITINWINKHFPNLFTTINCCNEHGSVGPRYTKADIISKLGCILLIDDSLKNAINVSPIVKHGVLLFDLDGQYRWNSDEQITKLKLKLHSNIKRVKSWNDVGEILEKL
jgi:uncharacterized HAD superfamily protein